MAFHYKLETLLRIRRNYEEQCQQKLAQELYVLENHKQYLDELHGKRKSTVESMENRKKKEMSAGLYSFYVESISNQDRQIVFQNNAIQAQQGVVAQVRAELFEKVKERKIVERLKEKDHQEYVEDLHRKAQIESDEMCMLRFGREAQL